MLKSANNQQSKLVFQLLGLTSHCETGCLVGVHQLTNSVARPGNLATSLNEEVGPGGASALGQVEAFNST